MEKIKSRQNTQPPLQLEFKGFTGNTSIMQQFVREKDFEVDFTCFLSFLRFIFLFDLPQTVKTSIFSIVFFSLLDIAV